MPAGCGPRHPALHIDIQAVGPALSLDPRRLSCTLVLSLSADVPRAFLTQACWDCGTGTPLVSACNPSAKSCPVPLRPASRTHRTTPTSWPSRCLAAAKLAEPSSPIYSTLSMVKAMFESVSALELALAKLGEGHADGGEEALDGCRGRRVPTARCPRRRRSLRVLKAAAAARAPACTVSMGVSTCTCAWVAG